MSSEIKFITFKPAEQAARHFAWTITNAGKNMPKSPDELAMRILEFDKYLAQMLEKQHELMVDWINTCNCRSAYKKSVRDNIGEEKLS